jgi:hypothetical protein
MQISLPLPLSSILYEVSWVLVRGGALVNNVSKTSSDWTSKLSILPYIVMNLLTLVKMQLLPFPPAMFPQYFNVVWLFSWTPKLKANL